MSATRWPSSGPALYDISEELITGAPDDSPLASLTEQQRVQINVRRIPLPWLGTHVLYVEEYPVRRAVRAAPPRAARASSRRTRDGTLRVRQFTRKADAGNQRAHCGRTSRSIAGCDLFLKRDGAQFRGGTRGRECLEHEAARARAGSTIAWSSATDCSGIASAR